MRTKIVAGNWKMNMNFEEGIQLSSEIAKTYTKKSQEEVILIPPYIHLSKVKEVAIAAGLKVGAQNIHFEKNGAFTGEISAEQLASLEIDYALVGHSERRKYFHESNQDLLKKIKALLAEGIRPIFCCGEELEARKSDLHFKTVAEQLKILWELSKEEFAQLVIAYEPVWAIGTGETASSLQAQEMHASIRALVKEHYGKPIAENCSILYGGSCKPDNAAELFEQADVDGGLIGGASLNANDFLAIVNAL